MDNIQKINELRRALKELRELGTLFKSDLLEIGNAIDHERFAPAESLKAWGERLLAWINKSVECFESYAQLFKEPLPDKFSDVEKLLDAEENRIRAANILVQAEKFLLFDAKSSTVKKILREHQDELKKLLARKRQNTRLKTSIETYAKFVDATEETDIGKKFSASTELRNFFGDDFIGRALFGGELIVEVAERVEPAKPEVKVEPVVTVVEKEPQPVKRRGRPKKVATPEPPPKRSFTEILNTSGALLKANNFASWEKTFTIDKNERTREFSAVRFKRDFKNAEMLKPLLSYVAVHGLLAWPAFRPKRMPKDIMETMAQLLLNKGYIQKYSFGEYDKFYGLTRNFFDFLKTDNGRKFIGSKRTRTELESTFFITEDAKHALVRAIYNYLYAVEIGHGNAFFDFEFFNLAFRADFIGNEKHDLFIGCFWDTADENERFLKRLTIYLKTFKKIDRLFIVGLSLQHAAKLFNVLEETFAEDFPKKATYYLYDATEDEFYLKDTQERIIPPDIWKSPSPPQDDPKPEETLNSEPEEVEEVPAVQKSEAPPLDMTVKEKVLSDVKGLLLAKKFYCATAYLKAQSLTLEALEPLYRQLAFALDDPLLKESYSAAAISILTMQDDDDFNEALITAAAIRAFFYNDFGVDYGVPALHALTKSFKLVRYNAPLEELLDALKNFKTDQRKGIDLYADYQTKDRQTAEENLAKVIRNAEDYYTRYFEGKITDRADNEIFIRMEQNLFSRNGDLAQIFVAIKDKDEAHSADTLNFVKDFLTETFIRRNAGFERLNIDDDKLNQFIDDKWDEACGKKNPGKLISRLRNNITKNLERAIEIMCAWVNCAAVLVTGVEDNGSVEYKRIRSRLIAYVQQARESLSGDEAGVVVLDKTLAEISARLDGSYSKHSHKYFYVEFLLGDKVALDENYLPSFDLNITDGTHDFIPEQIKKHAALKLPTFEERIEEIFEESGDDFGSAQLLDDYLKATGNESVIEKKEYDVSKCINSAAKDAPRYRESFIGGLELAQSYGQFDTLPEGEKEKILQLVDNCYKYAEASKNYGVFFRVKKYWEDVIEDNAAKRLEVLKADLLEAVENYKKVADNVEASELAESVAEIEKIIASRNFTAAQGLIFKLSRGELYKKFDDTEDTPLARFLDAEEYSDCYSKVKDSGDSLDNLIGKKIFPRDKVSRAKLSLVKNWITNPTGDDKIKTLLELLGFSVESVQKLFLLSANTVNFHVKIVTTGQRYSHPIAAFGSDAEVSGFNVSCLFGKFDEKNLVEKFKELGNSKHTLILLDYALDLPTRRRLAKEIKQEKSLTKVFALVDRVAIMYLLKNCAPQLGTKRITDTLMSIVMPFARCQPYIWSPRIPLPPEMFIGRENEINEVMNHGGVNIVCGGRQLGKSALLKMACRKVDGNNNERAIFIDIDDKNYREAALIVSHELSDKNFFAEPFETEDWEELTRAIRNRLASDTPTKIPYFLLMLDESDKFIETCAENNYAPIVALAKTQQEDYNGSRFKFVIAGLRNIIRFEREKTFSNNSILPTLKSLTIKPFNVEDARKLLEVPLRYLGLYFPDNQKDSLILTILETANYFPSLIQLYCEKLVKALFEPSYAGYDANTPIYRISEEHIKKILADREFTKDIKAKIEITLRLGEDKYYYVIANLMAYLYYKQSNVEGYSPRDIMKVAANEYDLIKEPFLPDSEDKVGALMEELCELNILRKTNADKYLFSRQRILRIIGTSNEVEDVLLKLMDEATHG